MSNLSYQRIYRPARSDFDNFFMPSDGPDGRSFRAPLVDHLDHGSSAEGRGPLDCRDQVAHSPSRIASRAKNTANDVTTVTPGHLPIATVTGLEIYKKTLNTTVLTNKSCLLSRFQVL